MLKSRRSGRARRPAVAQTTRARRSSKMETALRAAAPAIPIHRTLRRASDPPSKPLPSRQRKAHRACAPRRKIRPPAPREECGHRRQDGTPPAAPQERGISSCGAIQKERLLHQPANLPMESRTSPPGRKAAPRTARVSSTGIRRKSSGRTAISATRQPHLKLVILREAKDLLFAANCRSLASLGMTIHERCRSCTALRLSPRAARRSPPRYTFGRRPARPTSLPCQKVDQLFPRKPSLSQQRHQSSLRQVAIVLRHHGAAAGNRIVKNEVAARGVIQGKAVLFEKPDDLTRPNGG